MDLGRIRLRPVFYGFGGPFWGRLARRCQTEMPADRCVENLQLSFELPSNDIFEFKSRPTRELSQIGAAAKQLVVL
jgi:hypothetical protein